ncbi:hypothetical protein FACS1894142_2220 [Spirochaetia bacterium]|nr:hypothetical protein FACS1894142_2220 [Spirochaetia bacterium]
MKKISLRSRFKTGVPRTILLTGPKHSGKTSAGRVLAGIAAECSGGEFIDLDELIAQQTGKSPRSLFREGPEVFRAAEAHALQSLMVPDGAALGDDREHTPLRVIAAGGGLIDNDEARPLLEKPGGFLIICLEVPVQIAWERIQAAAANGGGLPPFLDTENPRATHRRLHRRRAAAYRKLAHVLVRGTGEKPGDMGREIWEFLCKEPHLHITGAYSAPSHGRSF